MSCFRPDSTGSIPVTRSNQKAKEKIIFHSQNLKHFSLEVNYKLVKKQKNLTQSMMEETKDGGQLSKSI